jgi:hypothetical protein
MALLPRLMVLNHVRGVPFWAGVRDCARTHGRVRSHLLALDRASAPRTEGYSRLTHLRRGVEQIEPLQALVLAPARAAVRHCRAAASTGGTFRLEATSYKQRRGSRSDAPRTRRREKAAPPDRSAFGDLTPECAARRIDLHMHRRSPPTPPVHRAAVRRATHSMPSVHDAREATGRPTPAARRDGVHGAVR